MPLAQARRAFTTWAPDFATITKRQAQTVATSVLKEFDSSTAARADRRALRELVADAAYRGRPAERAALIFAIERLGQSDGDFNAESYANLVEMQLRVLRNVEDFTDADFETARAFHQRMTMNYAQKRRVIDQPLTDGEWPNACAALVMYLGHVAASTNAKDD